MQIKESRERGRPRFRRHNITDFKALEYLALISMKYEIDSNAFFNGLIEASESQESKCENLEIKCFKKTRDTAIFLITKESKVVGQFPIPKHILEETNPLNNFLPPNTLLKKKQDMDKIKNPQIADLKVGMNKIALKAKVIEITKSKTVFTQLGQQKTLANAKIKDETGIIQLPLWNQQIGAIVVGDIIQVYNASVASYRGKLQLRVARGQQLSIIEKAMQFQ